MMNLWLLMCSMLVLALALFFLSLRIVRLGGANRDALNKELYAQRLKELVQDEAQGLLKQEEVLTELQLNLLDEVTENKAQHREHVQKLSLASGFRLFFPGALIIMAVAGSYFYLGSYDKLERWSKVMQRMPELTDRLLVQQAGDVTNDDLQDFILGLRSKLLKEPQDLRAWELMARIGVGLNDLQLAIDSYEQALLLEPKNEALLLDYARALKLTGDAIYIKQAEQILARLAPSQKIQLESLLLNAFEALQKEDYKQAIVFWRQALELLPKEHERRGTIERSILYAKRQLARNAQQGKGLAKDKHLKDEAPSPSIQK